jgi:hypothetical protein
MQDVIPCFPTGPNVRRETQLTEINRQPLNVPHPIEAIAMVQRVTAHVVTHLDASVIFADLSMLFHMRRPQAMRQTDVPS